MANLAHSVILMRLDEMKTLAIQAHEWMENNPNNSNYGLFEKWFENMATDTEPNASLDWCARKAEIENLLGI